MDEVLIRSQKRSRHIELLGNITKELSQSSTSFGNPYTQLWKHLWRENLSLSNLFFRLLTSKDWLLDQAVWMKDEPYPKLLVIIWWLWSNRNWQLWEGESQKALEVVLSSLTLAYRVSKGPFCPSTIRVSKPKQMWKFTTAPKRNFDSAFGALV